MDQQIMPVSAQQVALDAVQQATTKSPEAALHIARSAAVGQCMENIDQAATRLTFSLADVRQGDGTSAALSQQVSNNLDDFVGNSRTAVEICAHTTDDQVGRNRIENSLAEINGLFADDMKAIQESRLKPDAFMQGAETMSETIQQDLRALHTEFERVQDAEQEQGRDASGEGGVTNPMNSHREHRRH